MWHYGAVGKRGIKKIEISLEWNDREIKQMYFQKNLKIFPTSKIKKECLTYLKENIYFQ